MSTSPAPPWGLAASLKVSWDILWTLGVHVGDVSWRSACSHLGTAGKAHHPTPKSCR